MAVWNPPCFDSFGIRCNLPLFIQSLVNDRTFRFRVGTVLSRPFTQEEAILQGSVLNITLFGITINGIPTVSHEISTVHCMWMISPYLMLSSASMLLHERYIY